jgi:hypothetical protein
MSDISNYTAHIDTSRLSNTAGNAVLSLIVAVSSLNNPSSVMPLLALLGEFASKATVAGL